MFTEKMVIEQVVQELITKYKAIITFLRQAIPMRRLAFSMILPRPKDPPKHDEDLKKVNMALKSLCKAKGVDFLNTVKGISVRGQLDKSNYALDDLHLNWAGITGIKQYLKGATNALLKKKAGLPIPRCVTTRN